MIIDMASIRAPVRFIEIVDSERALFEIGNVEIISTKHEIADRIVTLRHEGWPDEYLFEELKAIEALKNYNQWPAVIEG